MSQNFKAVAQLQAELHLLKVEILDACIRPLFANPVTFAPCLLEFAPSLMISPNVDRSLLTKLSSKVSRILVQEIGLSSNPQDPIPVTKCGDSGATQGEITERNIQWRNRYTSRLSIIKTLMEDSLQLVYHCTIQRDKNTKNEWLITFVL